MKDVTSTHSASATPERTHCAHSSSPMATTVTASANDLFAQHLVLISRVKRSQKAHRRKLRSLPSPPLPILNLPTIPTPKPSPPPSPPSSPLLAPRRKAPRADLPPAKRARATHYENYVPEEETIRNDYSQRYVDGGEWPQNWVLGAEPERRFEEYVVASPLSVSSDPLVCASRYVPTTKLPLRARPDRLTD